MPVGPGLRGPLRPAPRQHGRRRVAARQWPRGAHAAPPGRQGRFGDAGVPRRVGVRARRPGGPRRTSSPRSSSWVRRATSPERTRAEMASLRPLGWETAGAATRAAHRDRSGGAAAGRAATVRRTARRRSVTDETLKQALAQVRRDAGSRLFGDPADVLYWRSFAQAEGLNDEQIVRRAGMPGLSKLGAKEIAARLHDWYSPGTRRWRWPATCRASTCTRWWARCSGSSPALPAVRTRSRSGFTAASERCRGRTWRPRSAWWRSPARRSPTACTPASTSACW